MSKGPSGPVSRFTKQRALLSSGTHTVRSDNRGRRARVMSHRKRESLPLRNARSGAGRSVCACAKRVHARRESCVARANADLTYCACTCALASAGIERTLGGGARFVNGRGRTIASLGDALVPLFRQRLEEVRKAEHRCNGWFAYPLPYRDTFARI